MKLPRMYRKLALFLALIGAAGLIATTAYTRDTPRSASFACDGGDRFTVEFQQGHVRLRNGTGIFALAREASSEPGKRFSDGRTTLWMDGDRATLDHTGFAEPRDCQLDKSA